MKNVTFLYPESKETAQDGKGLEGIVATSVDHVGAREELWEGQPREDAKREATREERLTSGCSYQRSPRRTPGKNHGTSRNYVAAGNPVARK